MSDRLKGSLGADGKIWCLPCAYYGISSPFGWRNHPYGGYKHHNGVDLTGYHNMPLYATKDGKITLAQYSTSAGNYMILDHQDGTKSVYMHMGEAVGYYPNKNQNEERSRYTWRVKVGDFVKQGQHIGDMGSTGCSTGTHLHFGVQLKGHSDPNSGSYVDPMDYIGGIKCSLDFDASGYITDDMRVDLTELPLDAAWKPMEFVGGSKEGSPKAELTRRHVLLGNVNTPLFSTMVRNCELSQGCGVFGLNTSVKSISSVEKSAVMSIYATRQSDGSYSDPYRKGSFSNDSEQTIATYIYSRLLHSGFAHNAIIAILANIRAESGFNPARWEQDIDWRIYDTDFDGVLDKTVYKSDGITPVKYYDGTPFEAGKKFSLGFGLIGRTPWYSFFNANSSEVKAIMKDLPSMSFDPATTPFDIDFQVQSLINYQANHYYSGWNSVMGSTYKQNILDSSLWNTNTSLMNYFKGSGYCFPITSSMFKQGQINTVEGVSLSSKEQVYVLTSAYTYNAERPYALHPNIRCKNAEHFLNMFGEDTSIRLFTPSVNKDEFWKTAKEKCGYVKSNKVIKNNLSYCISRANELIHQFYGTGQDVQEFIIKKDESNWFEYNKKKLKYEWGTLPRLGSIMCWKPVDEGDEYKVAIVEAVSGTHYLKASSYDPTLSKDNLVESKLLNLSNNWGESTKNYIFEGFIYILHELNIGESLESDKELATSTYKDNDGNIVVQLKNDTTDTKYSTIMFGINNMKHVNGVQIRYQAYNSNSKNTYSGNKLSLCLAQQVVNCREIGPLINYEDDAEKTESVNKELKNAWPFTYFPNKKAEMIKVGNQEKEDPETDPNRYHAPFPLGNITLDKISVDKTKQKSKEIISDYFFDTYVAKDSKTNKNVTFDSFDNNGKFKHMLRNCPGYLCLTLQTPGVSQNDAKNGQFMSTTLVIKEIILYG